jgi:hypothetical protein
MLAKSGAMFYVLWSLLHFKASQAVYQLAMSQEAGMVQARMLQDASFLFLVSVLVAWVAVSRNWNNDRTGYWINLWVVSIVDVVFIWLIVLPGYLPMKMALGGPVLWVLALLFSTLALKQTPSRR